MPCLIIADGVSLTAEGPLDGYICKRKKPLLPSSNLARYHQKFSWLELCWLRHELRVSDSASLVVRRVGDGL